MTSHLRHLTLLAAAAAIVLPAIGARAQSYGAAYATPAPLYPYAVPRTEPYAIQVAPNTYVIQRPARTRDYPYVRCQNCSNRAAIAGPEKAARFDRPHKRVDPALVEELRKRSQAKSTVVNTTQIVREAPVVVETKRYVDDPPRVIERRHVIEDGPVRSHGKQTATQDIDVDQTASRDDGKTRVIHAEAEVTIIGPDRMSIRLYRKRRGPEAKAQAGD